RLTGADVVTDDGPENLAGSRRQLLLSPAQGLSTHDGRVPIYRPSDGLSNVSARIDGASRATLQEVGPDERIDPAVEDRVHVTDLVLGPVVLHEAIRLQDVRSDLAAEVDVLLLPFLHLALLVALPELELVEA